jgi:hypothetical protein
MWYQGPVFDGGEEKILSEKIQDLMKKKVQNISVK